jgi:Concanavalin A-like lectin/glucanases superfamily
MLGLAGVALRAAGCAFPKPLPELRSLWQLDETSAGGGVFADSGPANLPMAIVGTWADLSTASMVQGIGGTSAYTEGSGYATIPANQPDHDLSELTISFYYQRNSAAAKHILLAAGDGTQVGDFSIEVLANGRLRGWHVGQDAVLRFFESTNGITDTVLQVSTAYRIDLTLGPEGARIYLDGAPLTDGFILAHQNGWNNARIKHLGKWTDGVTDGADGAFDRFRIWNRQLTSAQIADLETAQSIALPGAPQPGQELSVPSLGSFLKNDQPNATPTKYVSNQNRGNGSGSSPTNAQELQAALSSAQPGHVLQAVAHTPGSIEYWDYPTGLTFPHGSSGNQIVLEARQGDGIVLSRCENFAGARTPNSGYWTQSGLSQADIDKKIWRSVGTVGGGAEKLAGYWIEFDHPHQLLEANNMTNLRAPYGTANSPTNYSGPMVHKDSDNRVYIRMQRPHPGKYSLDNKWSNHIWPGHPEAISNGQIAYPVSENPNNYQIHIFRSTNANAIANGANFITLGNGINTLGYHHIATGDNLQFKRGIDLTWHSWITSTSPQNWFAERRRMSWGSVLHVSRAEWKFEGWLESKFRAAFIAGGGGSGSGNNLNFKDCTIADYHEIATGGGGDGNWRWRNCTFWHIVDDGLQVGTPLTRVEFGYCYFLGAAYGGYGFGGTESDDPNPGGWFFHHNIVDVREERGIEWRAQPPPKFPYLGHSPDHSRPHKNYNNTIFWGADIVGELPLGLGHLVTNQAVKNTSSVPHEVFNNIGIRQVWSGKRYDQLAGSGYATSSGANTGPSDFAWGKDTSTHPDRSNEFWDYNLWYRDLDGTAAADSYAKNIMVANNITTLRSFSSMAGWKASAEFQANKVAGAVRAAYSPGIEGNSTDVKPTMPSLDNFPADRFKYRPSTQTQVTTATSSSLSGANWWSPAPSWGATYFPWNDGAMTLAPSAWKGALDPNGSTNPVGVQNP